jgi:hypothetical protein
VVIFPVLCLNVSAQRSSSAVEKSTKHVSARQSGICLVTCSDGMKGAKLLLRSKRAAHERTGSSQMTKAERKQQEQERAQAITALEQELRENNRRYRDDEITRDEWVAKNRELDERGKPFGMRLGFTA